MFPHGVPSPHLPDEGKEGEWESWTRTWAGEMAWPTREGFPALWAAQRGCCLHLSHSPAPENTGTGCPELGAGQGRGFPTAGSLASPNIALSCACANKYPLGCSFTPKLFSLSLSVAM